MRGASSMAMMVVLMVIVMHGRMVVRMMCCRRCRLHAQPEAPIQILREAPHDADVDADAHCAWN